MKKLVILRPEPGASATLKRAEALGMDALAIPLFEIVPLTWSAPPAEEFDALLLTSANAARFGGSGLASLTRLPAYCVGEATAKAARAAGLTVVGVGAGGAQAIAGQIASGTRLLHLAGAAHRAIEGVALIAVYGSQPINPAPAIDAVHGAVTMVHSPRAGARLAEMVKERSDVVIAAMSRAAADACGDGWRRVEFIPSPVDGALLALAADLCQDRSL